MTKKKFDLEERSLEFAKSVIRFCKHLPQTVINKEIVAQLISASCSVGANYREANDSLSKKDFTYRIKISRKEAKETYYWLELLQEANPEYEEDIIKFQTEAVELRKIFSAIADKCS